jgi:PPM family protein phosphatase
MSTHHDPDTAEHPTQSFPPGTPAPPPAALRAQVDLGALSHPGNVRPSNEDYYLVVRVGRALQTLLTNLPPGHVPDRSEEEGYGLLVADGMGGHAAGEVAARLAVNALVNLVLDQPDWILRAGERENERLLQRMARRYRQVDELLRREAEKDLNLWGMGTTLTVACILGDTLFVGNLGDSRAYLHRGADLHRLTRDHTLAQMLADTGSIRPEEVTTHRFRHVLTRCLGGSEGVVEADVQQVRLSDGDQVLLCTDGLTDLVDDAAIAAVLQGAGAASAACEALVELALGRGGRDNVTVVLARYRFAPEPGRP